MHTVRRIGTLNILVIGLLLQACGEQMAASDSDATPAGRTRVLLEESWRFTLQPQDGLAYDRYGDSAPDVLKPWVLPTANAFIHSSEDRYTEPHAAPAFDVPPASPEFDDSGCLAVIEKAEPEQQAAFMMILDSIMKR